MGLLDAILGGMARGQAGTPMGTQGTNPLLQIALQMLQQNGVVPANPYFPDNAFASKPFTVEMDLRPIVKNYGAWSKKYDSFTRLGKS